MAQSKQKKNQTKTEELMFRQDCDAEIFTVAGLCERAISELLGVAKEQDAYMKKQADLVEIQETELQRRAQVMKQLQEETEAWYRNPYVMVLLGVAGGALAAGAVR